MIPYKKRVQRAREKLKKYFKDNTNLMSPKTYMDTYIYYTRSITMPTQKKHRNYSIYDTMITEMLEEILRADSQLQDSEDSDTDMILYIMEVIANREKEHSTDSLIIAIERL